MNRGDVYDFYATITGLNNPSQAVTWTVIGSNGTTGIDTYGKLTVGSNESATTLTVKATSIVDGSKHETATVTILQPPIQPTISSVEVTPNTVTVEKGSSYAFTANVTGNNNPPQSVLWSISGGASGTSIDENGVLMVSASETADSITVTATSTFDGSKFGAAVVTVPQLLTIANPQTPSIVANPQSLTVYRGDNVSLSVVANVTDGGILSYQWYKNSTNSNIGGTLIDGATNSTYTPPTSTVGVTYYYVIVANTPIGMTKSGIATTVSSSAVLTVRNYTSDGGGSSSNNGGSNGNSSSSNNNDSKNVTVETIIIGTSEITNPIVINGKYANATENSEGILEIAYTSSDLKDYADEGGDYVIEILGHSHVFVSLPISALENGSLEIKTDFGVVTMPNASLQSLRRMYGDDLRLSIKKGSFIVALLDSNGKEVAHNDHNNPLVVKLPYSLASGQKADSVIVVKKVGEDNVIVPLTNYKDGYISFTTASTGRFEAIYNQKVFADTKNHSLADSIAFVSARGLFSGIGNGMFSPDETMTRAMFITVLARLNGADLSQYTNSRFADVPSDSWYAASLAWAADIGLVVGVGNGNFAPNDPITRAQIDIVLGKYIQYIGSSTTGVSSFADHEPQRILTRAEATAVFVRLIEAINR